MKIKRLHAGQQVSINEKPYWVVYVETENSIITYHFADSPDGVGSLEAIHDENGDFGEIKPIKSRVKS